MTAQLSRTTLAVVGGALLVSGCVPQGLSFKADKRVEIVRPEERSEVTLPVTLEWTVRDFDLKTSPADSGGSFAVFVDRAPIPPGERLTWLARNDSTCKTKPNCPDAAYFAGLGVYETTDTRLEIKDVPGSAPRSGRRDRHRAVIVLLDSDGKRIDEIAFDVIFDLKRKG